MYRSSAIFMAGAAVITVIAFTSAGFGSSGKNALTAFAETRSSHDVTEEDAVLEEDAVAQAKVQDNLTDTTMQAQLLAGNLLEKEVKQKQQLEEEVILQTQRIKEQIASEEEAKRLEEEEARKAEEAAKKAEEEKSAHAMSVSQEDYNVLLHIVQAEAGICDDTGKILVANVILNRVRSGQFPSSVRGVVYAPSQFSPVSNGSIHSAKVTSDTIECVNRALSGEDYSNGALYFMYRRGSKRGAVSWFDSHLTYLFQHGNHEFFK